MKTPSSLRSDWVATMRWNGWPPCRGITGRNPLDQVAGFTGIRSPLFIGA